MDNIQFAIDGSVDVNTIIWLRSLRPEEIGPSERMVEDVQVLTVKDGFPVNVFEVRSRLDLLARLASIAGQAQNDGVRPIIHFDCHGAETHGLCLAPEGEYCSWQDFADALRTINKATKNNLVCVFATCFGSEVMKQVTLDQVSPAYAVIAPPQEITIGTLQAVIGSFYNELTDDGDLTAAYRAWLMNDMLYYHCQAAFFGGLVKYVRDHTKGRALSERKDFLLDETLKKAGITNPTKEQLDLIRKEIKARLKPTQEIMSRFGESFLMGKPSGFSFDDVLSEAVKK